MEGGRINRTQDISFLKICWHITDMKLPADFDIHNLQVKSWPWRTIHDNALKEIFVFIPALFLLKIKKLIVNPIVFSDLMNTCAEAVQVCTYIQLDLELGRLVSQIEGAFNSFKSKGSVLLSDACCVQLLQQSYCMLYFSSLLNLFPLLAEGKIWMSVLQVTLFQFNLSRKKISCWYMLKSDIKPYD